jgi:diguanylate cyclase (GGDEF)-like protein/PAS domain S-box-containing protein
VSLKLRASIIISAPVVALVLALTGFNVQRLWHDLMKSAAEHQLALVTRTADEIDNKLAVSQAQLANEALGMPASLLADERGLAGHLAGLRSLHAVFDTLLVVSASGRIVADYPEEPGRRGAQRADRDYVAAPLARRLPYVSGPILGQASKRPAVMVSVPLLDQAGEPHGVLVGRLKLRRDNLLGRIAAMRIGEQGHFFLLTRDGVYVMHPDDARIRRRYDEFEGRIAAVERGLAGFEGTLEDYDRGGKAFLYGFKRLARADWTLVAAYPSQEAFAPFTGLLRKMIGASLALALLLPLAIWLLVRRLLRPLERLRDAIRAVRRDPARYAEIPLDSNDEIGQVAREFARMVARLRWRESRQQRAERRLFAEKERAQATIQAIGDAVIVADTNGSIEFMNPVAEKLTGCDLLSATGAPVAEVLRLHDEKQGTPVEDPVRRAFSGGGLAVASECAALSGADGTARVIEYSAAPIRNGEQEVVGVVIAFRDITSARLMAQQVHWQACHDALTGLINRREFERRVEQALAGLRGGGPEHSILFLDLDQFKVVNDTCGHAAGDELLRLLSRALLAQIRQSDTLARLGGDEFGVLLQDCSLEQSGRVAECLRRAVEDFRFVWQDKTFRIGVSIGGVAVDGPDRTLAQVMSAADGACYVAKDSGRNRVHMACAEDGELVERHGQMQWVSRIHQALAEDRFRLWFQDIAPIGERRDEGDHYELLVRMVDETGKPVPPMAFIPAAERYHLMPAIDRWVVRRALAHVEKTYRPGAPRRLHTASINLSGASITDPNFLEFVRGELAARRVAPGAICFEITETAAIANLARAMHFISELKALGCRFSLDDFGSGMSSFAYLKNLRVDYLKIDGGFVKAMHRDPIDRAMVEAIHRIGNVMGIATIAEFVENDEIVEMLRRIGVDYAQGYGVARPRPLEELQAATHPPVRAPRVELAAAA